jgi:hypothetical protein
MTAAGLALGYVVLMAWGAPGPLSRLTVRGASPRLGLAAWLTAMASAVSGATAALWFLARSAVAGWAGLAEAVCRSVTGHVCAPSVYQSAAVELGLAAAAVVFTAAAIVSAWRYGRSVQRVQQRTRAHGEAARITGRALDSPVPAAARPTATPLADAGLADAGLAGTGPAGTGPAGTGPTTAGPAGTGPAGAGPTTAGPTTAGPAGAGLAGAGPTTAGPADARPTGMGPGGTRAGGMRAGGAGRAVVVDADAPAAYCVPRPATIVVTTGALAILDPDQLGAVLAHERAHLAGRHHLLTTLSRGLAAVFPAVPLFVRGMREVADLAEMAADDAAARRAGRATLVAALLTIGTGAAVPALAVPGAPLAATGGAVTARVQRLLNPPHGAARAAALGAIIALLAAAPALIAVLAVH